MERKGDQMGTLQRRIKSVLLGRDIPRHVQRNEINLYIKAQRPTRCDSNSKDQGNSPSVSNVNNHNLSSLKSIRILFLTQEFLM